MTKQLRITRIVTNVSTIEFTDEYYPGLTIEQATEIEREGEDNWEEGFFDSDDIEVKTFVEIVDNNE